MVTILLLRDYRSSLKTKEAILKALPNSDVKINIVPLFDIEYLDVKPKGMYDNAIITSKHAIRYLKCISYKNLVGVGSAVKKLGGLAYNDARELLNNFPKGTSIYLSGDNISTPLPCKRVICYHAVYREDIALEKSQYALIYSKACAKALNEIDCISSLIDVAICISQEVADALKGLDIKTIVSHAKNNEAMVNALSAEVSI